MHPRLFIISVLTLTFAGTIALAIHEQRRYNVELTAERRERENQERTVEYFRAMNNAAVRKFEAAQREQHDTLHVTASRADRQ